MKTWVIKRHGSNGYNQSQAPFAILGTVKAATSDDAIAEASTRWTCYANQHFEALPSDNVSNKVLNEALFEDANAE